VTAGGKPPSRTTWVGKKEKYLLQPQTKNVGGKKKKKMGKWQNKSGRREKGRTNEKAVHGLIIRRARWTHTTMLQPGLQRRKKERTEKTLNRKRETTERKKVDSHGARSEKNEKFGIETLSGGEASREKGE